MSATEKRITEIVFVLAETIKELGTVPSGHLYAACMANVSFDEYTLAISAMKRLNWITEKSHLITWNCPAGWDKIDAD